MVRPTARGAAPSGDPPSHRPSAPTRSDAVTGRAAGVSALPGKTVNPPSDPDVPEYSELEPENHSVGSKLRRLPPQPPSVMATTATAVMAAYRRTMRCF